MRNGSVVVSLDVFRSELCPVWNDALLPTLFSNFSATGVLPSECAAAMLDEEYYPLHYRILMTAIFSLLSVIGIVGNILVITVVLRVKGMATPTNCYLVSLAASDCLFFISTSPTELSYLHTSSSEYLFGSVGCSLFTYLPYLAINCSSLSITAFTIERFIGICHPYRARYICTVKRARVIIICIWLFSLVYNSPWLYLASVVEDEQGSFCSFSLERNNWTYKVMFLGDFFAFYCVPMCLNVIIYAKIALTLAQRNEKLKEPKKHSVTRLTSQGHSPTTGKARGISDTQVSQKSSAGKNQVVKMLAVVVLVFATCWLPYRAMVMYNSFSDHKFDSDGYIFFSKTMIFINCAINPILYNLMSGKFRLAFRRLLTGTAARRLPSPPLMTPSLRASTKSGRSMKKPCDETDRLCPSSPLPC